MNAGAIAGLVVGLIVAGVAVYLALRAVGYFQYLGGQKRSSIPSVTKETLMGRLLNLNDLSKPYSLIEGKETDLIAEWKIVDAQWYGTFSKSHIKQAYRTYLLLDEPRHTVRCYEELGTVSWTASADGLHPVVNYKQSFFRGRILYKKEFEKGYAIKGPPAEAGKVYEYKFDINEIRQPIVSMVRESGWEWVPVTAKRHATSKQSK
jgi:hypothetical protein